MNQRLSRQKLLNECATLVQLLLKFCASRVKQ
jgi:hypothetical protein